MEEKVRDLAITGVGSTKSTNRADDRMRCASAVSADTSYQSDLAGAYNSYSTRTRTKLDKYIRMAVIV